MVTGELFKGEGVDELRAERLLAQSRLWRSTVLGRWAGEGDRIASDYADFDRAHPAVYEAFKRFAWVLKRGGRTRASARDVLGRVRWDTQVNPGYGLRGEFKVNNNYAAVMARLLMAEDPAFVGFFSTRERKSVRCIDEHGYPAQAAPDHFPDVTKKVGASIPADPNGPLPGGAA